MQWAYVVPVGVDSVVLRRTARGESGREERRDVRSGRVMRSRGGWEEETLEERLW